MPHHLEQLADVADIVQREARHHQVESRWRRLEVLDVALNDLPGCPGESLARRAHHARGPVDSEVASAARIQKYQADAGVRDACRDLGMRPRARHTVEPRNYVSPQRNLGEGAHSLRLGRLSR